MNCHEFELTLRELVRDQLDVKTGESSLAHAEKCAMCAERLAAERALFAGVRAVMSEISNTSAPARVETALRAAFRAHVANNLSPVATPLLSNGASRQLKSIRSRLWPQWRLAAAAATIVVLISMIAVLWAQSKSSVEKPVTQAAIVVEKKLEPQTDVSVVAIAGSPDKARVRRPLRRKAPEAEVVTEFYPLMEGADLDSLEVVQMVRVELPGSALRAAGLPVAQELMNEPVKADVMLGYDGLARAIRFVR